MCPEDVLMLVVRCLEGVWSMSGRHLKVLGISQKFVILKEILEQNYLDPHFFGPKFYCSNFFRPIIFKPKIFHTKICLDQFFF